MQNWISKHLWLKCRRRTGGVDRGSPQPTTSRKHRCGHLLRRRRAQPRPRDLGSHHPPARAPIATVSWFVCPARFLLGLVLQIVSEGQRAMLRQLATHLHQVQFYPRVCHHYTTLFWIFVLQLWFRVELLNGICSAVVQICCDYSSY
jgi:hypothetical protein